MRVDPVLETGMQLPEWLEQESFGRACAEPSEYVAF